MKLFKRNNNKQPLLQHTINILVQTSPYVNVTDEEILKAIKDGKKIGGKYDS